MPADGRTLKKSSKHAEAVTRRPSESAPRRDRRAARESRGQSRVTPWLICDCNFQQWTVEARPGSPNPGAAPERAGFLAKFKSAGRLLPPNQFPSARSTWLPLLRLFPPRPRREAANRPTTLVVRNSMPCFAALWRGNLCSSCRAQTSRPFSVHSRPFRALFCRCSPRHLPRGLPPCDSSRVCRLTISMRLAILFLASGKEKPKDVRMSNIIAAKGAIVFFACALFLLPSS